jgi:hypothetical protein
MAMTQPVAEAAKLAEILESFKAGRATSPTEDGGLGMVLQTYQAKELLQQEQGDPMRRRAQIAWLYHTNDQQKYEELRNTIVKALEGLELPTNKPDLMIDFRQFWIGFKGSFRTTVDFWGACGFVINLSFLQLVGRVGMVIACNPPAMISRMVLFAASYCFPFGPV